MHISSHDSDLPRGVTTSFAVKGGAEGVPVLVVERHTQPYLTVRHCAKSAITGSTEQELVIRTKRGW